MSTLVLVEFLEDVPSAIRLARSAGATPVALTPEAMQAFDEAGQAFEPWTTLAQHARGNVLAADSLARVATLADAVAADESDGLSIVRCYAHELHVLFCSVAFRALALQELVERWAPVEIIGFQPEPKPVDGVSFRPHESAMAAVIASAAAAPPEWGAAVEWRLQPSKATPRGVRARIARSSRRSPWRAAASEWGWAVCARETLRRLGSPRSQLVAGARILVVGANPEFRFLRGDDEPRFVHWPSRGLPPVGLGHRRSVPSPRAVPDLPVEMASWARLDCAHALSPRWQWLRTGGSAQIAEWRAEAETVLDAVAPCAVVHGEVGAQSWLRTVLETARVRQVPRAFLQWGGNYGYMRQPYLGLTELDSDLVLAYTDGVASLLPEASGLGTRCPPRHVVGSPHLSALGRRTEPWKPTRQTTVVYAPLALMGQTRYGPHHGLDDTLFCVAEWRIAEILATAFVGRVRLKLHPSIRAAVEPIRSRLNGLRLQMACSTDPIESMLQTASVWVIDGVATTLQQLVMARLPVVYVNMGGPSPLLPGEQVIREAVDWVDFNAPAAPAALIDAVNRAAKEGPRPGQVEFQRQFVTDDVTGALFASRVRQAVGVAHEHPAHN